MMKYCPNCGCKLQDNAVYCSKCGQRVDLTDMADEIEKDKSIDTSTIRREYNYTNLLNVLICLLLVGCVAVGIRLYTLSKEEKLKGRLLEEKNYEHTAEAYQNASKASSRRKEAKGEEILSSYIDYFNTKIASRGVIDDQERKTGVVTYDNIESGAGGWFIRTGVIGMDLADLDSDGTQEMVVYYADTKKEEYYSEPISVLYIYADIYKINEAGEITKITTTALTKSLSGTETEVEKAGIMSLNGKEYIYQYEAKNAILANGKCEYYVLYTLDKGSLRRAYALGQEGMGSAGLSFVVMTYTEENEYATVLCAHDGPIENEEVQGFSISDDYIEFNYDNRYECDEVCWKQLGVEAHAPRESIIDGADYWNTDLVRGGYSFIVHSSDVVYADNGITASMYSEIENRTEYRGNAELMKELQDSNDTDSIAKEYKKVLDLLTEQYGEMRVLTDEDSITSVNGVCYAELIDFKYDGVTEMIVLCKQEEEEKYTCYIYTVLDGKVKCIYTSDEMTSGPKMNEAFVLVNSEDHGYLIMSHKGDDVDEINTAYGFDREGDEFGALRKSEIIAMQDNDGSKMTYTVDGILSGECEGISAEFSKIENQDRQNWFGNYAVGPSFTVRYWRDEGQVNKEYFESVNETTKKFLENEKAFEALEKLRKVYIERGAHVYNPELNGNTIFADIYTVGVGNLSRVCWAQMEIDSGKITENN